MKLESLKSSKFQTLNADLQSKILGGYTIESSGTARMEVTSGGQSTWQDVPERVTMDNGLIICREHYYDGAWRD